MSSVKQRPNGRWRARWREPGGKQRARHFATESEAKEWLITVAVDRRQGTYVDFRAAQQWTVERWWAEWWPIAQLPYRPSTRLRDETMWRLHIRPGIGHLTLDQLDEFTVDRWAAGLHDKLAPASAQKCVQIVSRMMKGAIRSRIIVVNPAAGVAMPESTPKEMVCLEANELLTMCELAGDQAPLLTVLGWCGLRFGEAAALNVRHVDLMARTIRVERTYSEVQGVMHLSPGPKTKAGRRVVPISAPVVEVLLAHTENKSAGDLVFELPRGGPVRLNKWRADVFKPLAKAIGHPTMRPHDLRHTAITLWLAAGADPHEVARWAGHSSVATVLDRYGHVMVSRTTDVMAKLGEMATVTPAPEPAVDVPSKSS
jgi:integrase